jgi:hypothetical protein
MYYVVPGFGALRTPSRWIWVAGWAASGLIAMGLSTSPSSIKRYAAIIGVLFLAFAGGKSIKQVRALPGPMETPAVYKWLAGQPGKVMVILPMAEEEWEMDRLPYALVHDKKTLNGFSGFYPPPLIKLGSELTDNFPNEKTINELKDLNVNWVVIDKQMYNEQCTMNDENCGRITEIKKTTKDPVWEDHNYAVYGL